MKELIKKYPKLTALIMAAAAAAAGVYISPAAAEAVKVLLEALLGS